MKLLILTQYYPPEIGAPQNRLHELAVRLSKTEMQVEVLTAMPNYPKMEIFEEYKDGKIREETIDGIKVYRAGIYASRSGGIAARLLNYFSFVYTSWRRGRKLGHYDFIMVESPPLFLGYSGMALARKLKAKMIFNVSDLWPESAEKLGIVTNRHLLKMAYKLEARCYRRSAFVTAQTQGGADNIRTRFPEVDAYWLPNGVDVSFYDPAKVAPSGFRKKHGFAEDEILFFYGGILGYAQGLDLLLSAAARVKNPKVRIILQGTGPEEKKLKAMHAAMMLKNVTFLPPVAKQEMPGILKEVDVAIIPLKRLDIFLGVIPSKVFEALAMEVPLLLGVEGEAKKYFITEAQAGLAFEPENEEDLVAAIEEMAADREKLGQMGTNGRAYVVKNFNRDIIARNLVEKFRKFTNGQ